MDIEPTRLLLFYFFVEELLFWVFDEAEGAAAVLWFTGLRFSAEANTWSYIFSGLFEFGRPRALLPLLCVEYC